MIGNHHLHHPATAADPLKPPDPLNPLSPLLNLSLLNHQITSLRSFLSHSLHHHIPIPSDHLHLISGELISAVHLLISNASSLLSSSSSTPSGEIVEIAAGDLISDRAAHICEICGKSFRRDANLRMHMRAHGDRFKTPESLSNKNKNTRFAAATKFSCPFVGCRRHRSHPRFRPLKTSVCARNHFRRSHCAKLYACDLCRKKSFAVAGDLRSHRKSCGEVPWRCSCGTGFCRKDKLFGHVALFDGHFPVVEGCGGEGRRLEGLDEGFFDGLMEEIGGMGF